MRKFIVVLLVLCSVAALFCGCFSTEADKVNHNVSVQADHFECLRHITVYNARTDKIIFEAEGYMSLSNNLSDELVITFKVGQNEYKKNYVYLNDYTLYVLEDISGTYTDPYHYKWYFHTEILPSIEVKP